MIMSSSTLWFLLAALTCLGTRSLADTDAPSDTRSDNGDSEWNVLYTCPSAREEALNYEPYLFQDYETQELLTMEMSDLLQRFRNTNNGDWGKTYEQVKENTRAWKQQYVVPFIQSGDKIYESASGIGLNLLFTMEILNEERPGQVNNVTLYGNEYLESSTALSNTFLPAILQHALPAGMARLGQPICQHDSSDLAYIPDDTFDLVYTGYVSPILDLLNWKADNPEMTAKEIHFRFIRDLCRAANNKERHAVEQLELAQRVQQDFYAAWVGEMIRIAKPGKPIVIEQVSQEKCQEITDNGGVAFGWWKEAILAYKWPVDPTSLAFGKDYVFDTNRYHVFMRKLNADGTPATPTNGEETVDETNEL